MKDSARNIFLLSILLLYSYTSYAQNQWIDSVKKVLAIQKEDTSKVLALISLSYDCQPSYPDSSLGYAQQALALAEKLNFESGKFWAEISACESLMILGNYPMELDYAFKALSLSKKLNTPLTTAVANAKLCGYYYSVGEYTTGLSYWREVQKITVRSFPDEMWGIWAMLSQLYHGMNQPDSAMFYAKKAYEKIKADQCLNKNDYQSINQVSVVFTHLGNAFAGKAYNDSALYYYHQGIYFSKKIDLQIFEVECYNGIAAIYRATGRLDSAVWYAEKVLTGKVGKSYPASLQKASNLLSDIYELRNKPDSALKYLKITTTLKDSLFNRERMVAIQNLTYKEQEKQQEIAAAKIKLRNQFTMYFLLAGFIMLFVIAGILFRNRRRKQLQNMRNNIADDLHDDIGSTLTNISILTELSKQHLDSKDNANKFLSRISEEVNSTSEALDDIIWSVNMRNDSVDEIMLRMRRYAGELFDAGGLKYELSFDDALSGIKLGMDQRRDLYLVFKEAVNNIYKHANASKVTIELKKEGHELVMRINDDGKGFEMKPSHRNGFKNMQSRAKKRKGHLQIESVLHKGTNVNLFFPLK